MSERHHHFGIGVIAIITIIATFPASVGTSTSTLYLHSLAPIGNVDEDVEFALGEGGPTMDSTAPSSPAPKVTQTSAGNSNYNRNFLLGFWTGEVHGNLTDITANLWVSTPTGGTIEVSLFADQPLASAAYASRASVVVPFGGARLVTITLPTAGLNVDKTLTLSIYAGTQGVQVYYDSVDMPSSLSFSVGPYVPPPPPGTGSGPTPAPGWGPVTVMSLSRAARETSLYINPANEDVMIACDPSGVPNTGNGESYFYQTSDAGMTWSELRVETEETDLRQYAFEGGDCDVAFDAAGTMYSADTWLGDLSVGHSTDGGVTWAGTPLAVTSPIVDRPWLVGGPAGTIHITYQDVQFGMPTAIWYTRSTDYGVTFLPAVPVAIASADNAFSWEGNFVVSPDGQDLYLVYNKRANGAVGVLSTAEQVWVAASHDGGASWTSHKVANTAATASYLYPSIGMDAGGILHVVYASRVNPDQPVWYAASSDEGLTWTTPVKLRSGVTAYSPWVVGGEAGEAFVQWYGSPVPKANLTGNFDWYNYWAKVTDGGSASPTITSGTTTTTPVFSGRQGSMAEFNMVRLDSDGKMRLGTSIMRTSGTATTWAAVYQAEI